MKRLEEICTLTSGSIITRLTADKLRGEIANDVGRKTIVSKTVEKGYISESDIVVNDYKDVPADSKLTKEGDIVIKLAAPYRAAIIDKEHEGMFISSFCSVIREISKDVDPNYLVAYLNSDICVQQLETRAVGSVMKMLSNGKLGQLPVPTPDMSIQKEIGDYFIKSVKNIALLEKITKLEQEKLNALIHSKCEVK